MKQLLWPSLNIFGVILLLLALFGCITPQPIRLVTYEFDQKSQQWKRMTCLTSVPSAANNRQLTTECQMDLAEPPIALEKQ